MDLKYITGPITKADAGGLSATITTPRVDSDGESVDPLGLMNRDEYLANPLVYWAHEWAMNPAAEPIGQATDLTVHRDRIDSAAIYAPTPKAQNIRALVLGKFVRKTSVGFDSLRMELVNGIPTHTGWALREWSVVPMPANTDATITGVKSARQWLADKMGSDRRLDATALIAAASDGQLDLEATPGGVLVRDKATTILTLHRRKDSADDVGTGSTILALLAQLKDEEADTPEDAAILQRAIDAVLEWLATEAAEIGSPDDMAASAAEDAQGGMGDGMGGPMMMARRIARLRPRARARIGAPK